MVKKSYKRIRDLYDGLGAVKKNSLWFIVCNVLLKGINLIIIPLVTFFLTEEEYGKLSVYMTFEQIFLILATWEIPIGAYMKGFYKYKGEDDAFRCVCIMASNGITLFLGILYFAFYKWIYPAVQLGYFLFVLLMIYAIVQPAYHCWLTRQRIAFDYRKAVAATFVYGIGAALVPLLGILSIGKTADIKFGTQILFSFIFFMPFYISAILRGAGKLNWENVKTYCGFIIRYEPPLVFHSLSYLVLGSADRIMIAGMAGNVQAAYYSVGNSLASVMNLFQTAIANTMTPWIYMKMEQDEYEDIKKNVGLLCILMAAMLLLFILMAPEAITLFFRESYSEAVWCIPPIAAGTYFVFCYSIYVSIETYYEVTKYIGLVSICCAILNIVLNYCLIGRFGYLVCGYTTLVSYMVFCAAHFGVAKVICRKKENDIAKIINGRFLLGIGSIFLLCVFLITLVYRCMIIRYIFLCLCLTMLFVCRKRIKILWRDMGKNSKGS